MVDRHHGEVSCTGHNHPCAKQQREIPDYFLQPTPSPHVPPLHIGDKLPSLLFEHIPNQGDQYLSNKGRKIYCAKHFKVYFNRALNISQCQVHKHLLGRLALICHKRLIFLLGFFFPLPFSFL